MNKRYNELVRLVTVGYVNGIVVCAVWMAHQTLEAI